jgi:hypothetical protein
MLPRIVGINITNINIFKSLFAQYQNNQAMTYFWLTVVPLASAPTNPATDPLTTLGPTFKSVIQFIEAPANTDPAQTNLTNPNGEFSACSMFYNALAYSPSNTNRISPMAFKELFGVTQYPTKNAGPMLTRIKQANSNYVAFGMEGGINVDMVFQGVTLDGYDYFNWWYTIDYAQITINQNLSNAIINGSNNPLAPLYYNQDGINVLASVLYATMQSMRTFGMVVGQLTLTQFDGPSLTEAINSYQFIGMCDINAVPFIPYSLANPGHYKIGEYDGLSTLFIPQRGFIHILVNVVASSLIAI